MRRYYGYFAQRMSRLGELLAIGASSGAVLTLLFHLPDRMTAAVAAAVARQAAPALSSAAQARATRRHAVAR